MQENVILLQLYLCLVNRRYLTDSFVLCPPSNVKLSVPFARVFTLYNPMARVLFGVYTILKMIISPTVTSHNAVSDIYRV